MIHTFQVVTSNLIGIILLTVLLLNIKNRFQRERKDNIAFVLMVVVNIILCIIEPTGMLLEGKDVEGLNLLLRFINALCYIFNITFAMLWTIYTKLRLRAKIRNKKFNVIEFVPGLIIIILSMINIIPGMDIFFSIDGDNFYHRNQISFIVATCVTYCYLVLGVFYVYKYKKSIDEYTFIPVFTFLTPIFLASIGQTLFPGISVLWCGAAIGLVATYMSLVDETTLIDPLSGVLSRLFLDRYIGDLPKNLGGNRFIVGFMLDIDEFKAINDKLGHIIGDDAISCFAKIIRKTVGIDGMVFRFGGDEFVIIMTMNDEQEITKLVNKIDEEIEVFNKVAQKPYQLSYSCGCTKYIGGESNQTFIERMDKEMYKVKNFKKGIVTE